MDKQKQLAKWKDRWNHGDVKFVPELFEMVESLMKVKRFVIPPLENEQQEEFVKYLQEQMSSALGVPEQFLSPLQKNKPVFDKINQKEEKGLTNLEDETCKVDNIEIWNSAIEPNVLNCDIFYPKVRSVNKIDTIQIGLVDVRAADDIQIHYDYDRDGWVVRQSRDFHPKIDEHSAGLAEEWFEAAFIPAWQFELEEEEKFTYKPTGKNKTIYHQEGEG